MIGCLCSPRDLFPNVVPISKQKELDYNTSVILYDEPTVTKKGDRAK
jgi:hypothetical protein